MSEPIRIIYTRRVPHRILLIGIAAAALIFAWFVVRWQVASMLAELTSPANPDAKTVAAYATSIAPRDPNAWWLAASTEKDLFTPEKIETSVHMFERVVRLSPNDYRWWTELGRSYEQAERPAQAEFAFRRAIELAPAYAYPHWQLANFLLRQGRDDEASAELRRTTENNVTYRNQVFSLAWDYFGKDPAKIESLASDDPDVRASLAQFYANRKYAADSLRVWNTLSDEEKAARPAVSKAIAQALYELLLFRQAVEFARQSGVDKDAHAEAITNPGFEDNISNSDSTLFGWKIDRTDPKSESSPDLSVKHSGARSLRTVFRNYQKPAFYGIWQNVAVEPNGVYNLRFWVRTENLKSAGTPVIEIVNGPDSQIIAVSKPFDTGTTEWQEYSVDFTIPANSDALFIRSSRSYCGDACPLVGTMWLDDFILTRIR
jgi:hypothetical protein